MNVQTDLNIVLFLFILFLSLFLFSIIICICKFFVRVFLFLFLMHSLLRWLFCCWFIVLCTSHCVWGFFVGLWFSMHYFMSFLVLQSSWRGRERAGFFAFIVFWMSCYCKCLVALPRGAVYWSAVYDCGISWSYSLTFVLLILVHIHSFSRQR